MAALAVALLWLAAPLLSLAHATTAAHTYCARHGILEEGGAGGSDAQPDRPLAAATADGVPAVHEACSFARLCRFGQTLAPLVLAVGEAAAPEPALAPRAPEPAPAIAILDSAPKTSPPAAPSAR